MISEIINKSMENWFNNIENKLREIKNSQCPELTDEEFGKMLVIEFHYDCEIPFALIRLKTVDEILNQ